MTTAGPDLPSPAPTQREKRLTLHNQSQRRINMLWESTQSAIALGVVTANICVLFVTLPSGAAKEAMMANAFFLIIGFYFGRTNHAKTGGIEATRGGPSIHE